MEFGEGGGSGSARLWSAKGKLPTPHTGSMPRVQHGTGKSRKGRWWTPIPVRRRGRVTSMAARPPRFAVTQSYGPAATSALPSAAASYVASVAGQRSRFSGPGSTPCISMATALRRFRFRSFILRTVPTPTHPQSSAFQLRPNAILRYCRRSGADGVRKYTWSDTGTGARCHKPWYVWILPLPCIRCETCTVADVGGSKTDGLRDLGQRWAETPSRRGSKGSSLVRTQPLDLLPVTKAAVVCLDWHFRSLSVCSNGLM